MMLRRNCPCRIGCLRILYLCGTQRDGGLSQEGLLQLLRALLMVLLSYILPCFVFSICMCSMMGKAPHQASDEQHLSVVDEGPV